MAARAGWISRVLCLLPLPLLSPGTAGAGDLIGHGAPVRDIAIAPDGARAITSGFDDVAILWTLPEGTQRARLYGHDAAVNAAAFLPEGRAVTVSDDGTARIWSLDTATERAVLSGHERKVVDVAVSPDGGLIATASWDRTIRVWDAAGGVERAVLEGHEGPVNAVRFTPDGGTLISVGYDGTIRHWPIGGNDAPAGTFATVGFPINDIALLADGRRAATASADGALRLWDMESGENLREVPAHDGAMLTVAASPDGHMLATGGTDGHLFLWHLTDVGTGESEVPAVDVPLEHYRAVWSIAFTPDGATVYASGIDRVTRAFKASDGSPVEGTATPFQPIERVSRDLADSDDPVERGSFQFRKCAVCHSLDAEAPPRSGPTLDGIFGRRVGGLRGYTYSDALRAADFVWTPETVSQLFAEGPDVMLPGTKMPIQRMPDAQARADLMTFLKHATEDASQPARKEGESQAD
ncbi:hypothetical protein KAJ83_05165 [Marivibrio halodurans]|uniref:Cytochrome c domain-containing protein n=1 Tax=Marivibrio halodurans TaxID=2039722 RepID=A0A8J7SLP9_9PROT|nr:c-type cytochrome [Marivibrio halodurans]MBP5856386.1 hypothetical protein [Marivibrio halodurans]